MAYPSARRLVEAAITHLRPLSITLMEAPSARSALALSARASSSLGIYDAAFQASSAASGVGGSSPTPSAVCVFASAVPATTSTTFPADAILAFEDAFTSSAASAAASRAGSFSVIAFHDAFASPAASAASTSSPTLAYLVVTSSDADDDSDCTVPAASPARGSSPTPSAVYCFTSTKGAIPAVGLLGSGQGRRRFPRHLWGQMKWSVFLRDLEPSDEDEKKLKKVFFDKFYAGKIVDPSTLDLKLDVLLHRVDKNTQLAKDIKGTKKWGTFVFRGKKLDLSTIVAAIIGMF